MARFADYYRHVGAALTEELFTLLEAHEHVALLGPRQGGKAFALQMLADRVAERCASGQLRLATIAWDERTTARASDVLASLAVQLGLSDVPPSATDARLAGQVCDVLRAASRVGSGPMWVFVRDIVGFARPVARQVLEAFRLAYYDEDLRDRLAVVVTGSADLVPLTYGATSPFRHAFQIVLCGFDKPTALEYVRDRLRRLRGEGPGIDISAEAFELLYEQTQGNPHLIQELVATVARHPYHAAELSPDCLVSAEGARACIEEYARTFMPDDFYFRMMLREVEYLPESFDVLLQVLRRSEKPPILPAGLRPHQLEVCGLMYSDERGAMRISCPMLHGFASDALTPRQIADVYAYQGRWTEAWKRYASLPSATRERPISGHARFHLREVVRDWRTHLGDKAYEGIDAVARHFLNGMQHLFGFDAGGLYDRDTGRWLPQMRFSGKSLGPIAPIPRGGDDSKGGHLFTQAPDRLTLWCVPSVVSRLAERPNPALLLRRLEMGREIDHAEYELIVDAVRQFWRAYETAQDIEYRSRVGELRERHLKAIEAMNAELLREPADMGRVVRCAARALVEIAGYHRALICLVDAKRERIQAVASHSADPAHDFDRPTDYPLSDPDADVHPWVVVNRQTLVIDNAQARRRGGPRVNVGQARAHGIKGLATVPMMDADEVIGTIHVERADREPPGPDEVQLVEIFAGQAAGIIRQAQRLAVLQGAVDGLHDQVRIVDPTGRVVYMNPIAATESAVQPGWQSAPPPYDWSANDWAENAPDPAVLTRITPTRHARRLLTSAGENETRAMDWQMARIDDFRANLEPRFRANATIAYVERVHDMSGLYQVLAALASWLRVSDVRSMAQRIARTCVERGFPWCRVYRREIAPDGRELLRSFVQIGLIAAENRRRFDTGGIVDESGEEPLPQPWHAVSVAQEPAIYEHAAEGSIPDGATVPAEPIEGAPRYVTRDVRYRDALEMQEDSAWIDAPLVVADRTLGLVSLGMPRGGVRPERWALLKLMVQCVALALDHAIRAEEHAEAEKWRRTGEMTTWIFHGLRTPLASCRLFVSTHQERSRSGTLDMAQSVEIVEEIGGQIERLEHISKEYTRHMRAYQPVLKTGDIVSRFVEVCRTFGRTHAGMRVVFEADCDSCSVNSDIDELARALDELLQNAATAGATESRVRLEGSDGAPVLQVIVQDNGRGVPDEVLPRLFDPDPHKSRTGTGLGLANIRKFLETLGGSIRMARTGAEGTLFTLTIPTGR